MKKLIAIITILISSNFNYAQIAVINNDAGFIEVRKDPKDNSVIIYTLKNDEVFVYNVSEIGSESNWNTVFISKNKYQLECGDAYDSNIIGYIPKDLIYPIEYLPKESKGSHISFKYKLAKFNKKNKILDFEEQQLTKINGRKIYGTTGNIPTTEVIGIDAKINGNKIEIPSILYQDIFECDNDFMINSNKDNFIIHQWNGVGPTEYLIVWVLGDGKLKQRLILKP